MTSPPPLHLLPHTFLRKVRQRRKIKDDVRRNQKHTPPALPAAPGINLQIARDACKTHIQIHTRNHAETPIHTEYVCIDRHTHTLRHRTVKIWQKCLGWVSEICTWSMRELNIKYQSEEEEEEGGGHSEIVSDICGKCLFNSKSYSSKIKL